MKSRIFTPNGVLSIEQDAIPVQMMIEADPNWLYTDKAGHLHYHAGEQAADIYPTLREVEDDQHWCGSCDESHADTHLECRMCGEVVFPGTRSGRLRHIAGR